MMHDFDLSCHIPFSHTVCFTRRRRAEKFIVQRTLLTSCCTKECFKQAPDNDLTLGCLLGCMEEVDGLCEVSVLGVRCL